MAFLRQIPVQYKGIQQKGLMRWPIHTYKHLILKFSMLSIR